MIDKINLIISAKNTTARQFAEEIGVQPSSLSHILSGRNNPSLEFICKILRRYPEIDANWLLRDQGQMYDTAAAQPLADEEPPAGRAEEPSLFADERPLSVAEPSHKPYYQQDAMREEAMAARYAPSYIAMPPDEAAAAPAAHVTDPALERVLFCYRDGTFREYRQRTNL